MSAIVSAIVSATARASLAKTCTHCDAGDPHDLHLVNKFPNGRIQDVLVAFHKKYRRNSLLDKIQLDKDIMLTIEMKPGVHPDKQFNQVYMILLRYSHKTVQPTHEDLIAQSVVEFYNPYNTCYAQKIIKAKVLKYIEAE